jgi:sugar phosphate isomerase/epimerase
MSGVKVISVQSLLYNNPNITLLGDRFVTHMSDIIRHVTNYGCYHLVFGSPSQRNEGAKFPKLATEILQTVGDIAHLYGAKFALESIPEYMGSTFLTTPEETIDIIKKADSKGLSFNFDINNISAVDPQFTCLDDINVNIISHVHISSSQGQPIHLETKIDYELAIEKLKRIGYNGWVSIEMLKTPNEYMIDSVRFVRGLL